MKTFGLLWSRALCMGCATLSVHPEWVLRVLALEGGYNPMARNASGARGMWQKMPDQVSVRNRDTGKLEPLVLTTGASPPTGCILRNVRDAKGVVIGQSVWRLYGATDPLRQLTDYIAWTAGQLARVNAGTLTSAEALYCCNIAPERLRDGRYTPETLLYSAPSASYKQNAAAFGLDPNDPFGRLRMKHIAVGLDAAVARHRARYDAELEAAMVANVAPPPPDEAS